MHPHVSKQQRLWKKLFAPTWRWISCLLSWNCLPTTIYTKGFKICDRLIAQVLAAVYTFLPEAISVGLWVSDLIPSVQVVHFDHTHSFSLSSQLWPLFQDKSRRSHRPRTLAAGVRVPVGGGQGDLGSPGREGLLRGEDTGVHHCRGPGRHWGTPQCLEVYTYVHTYIGVCSKT